MIFFDFIFLHCFVLISLSNSAHILLDMILHLSVYIDLLFTYISGELPAGLHLLDARYLASEPEAFGPRIFTPLDTFLDL